VPIAVVKRDHSATGRADDWRAVNAQCIQARRIPADPVPLLAVFVLFRHDVTSARVVCGLRGDFSFAPGWGRCSKTGLEEAS